MKTINVRCECAMETQMSFIASVTQLVWMEAFPVLTLVHSLSVHFSLWLCVRMSVNFRWNFLDWQFSFSFIYSSLFLSIFFLPFATFPPRNDLVVIWHGVLCCLMQCFAAKLKMSLDWHFEMRIDQKASYSTSLKWKPWYIRYIICLT